MIPPHNAYIQDAIELCWKCRHHCQQMLFNECLTLHGQQFEPMHVCTMMETIEICQLAADFMTRNSLHYETVVRACVEICRACAANCAKVEIAEECAKLCELTADACAAAALQQVGEAGA